MGGHPVSAWYSSFHTSIIPQIINIVGDDFLRPVTADHVMFNECIRAFRPEKIETFENEENNLGYLLLDFSLTKAIDFDFFKIEPTIEVGLPGAYSAFIAPVQIPDWFEFSHNSHLFTIALAAIFSFVTSRPVKAPRDGYISGREELSKEDLQELAIQFPVLTAGPGGHGTRLSSSKIEEISLELRDIVEKLNNIPYKLYTSLMQSIRLVHLAHLNKRDDFGLAYTLLVSSIESTATEAISRDSVKFKHPKENEWKKMAKTNRDMEELLQLYRQQRGKNEYISDRFIKYILKYSPSEQWENLDHPLQDVSNYTAEITGEIIGDEANWITNKKWYEKYPDDSTDTEIEGILKDLYNHRSRYLHDGSNPPHDTPNSFNRFFDTQYVIVEKNGEVFSEEIDLPNFQLISFIAKDSLFNYLKHINNT